MVKTVRKEEMRLLLSLVPRYYHHVRVSKPLVPQAGGLGQGLELRAGAEAGSAMWWPASQPHELPPRTPLVARRPTLAPC